MSSFLAASRIVREYRQGDTTLRVLDQVTVEVNEGEFLVVVGPSGAGKSTLLHVLGLLDRGRAGHVSFEGRNVSGLGGREQARLRNELFGFVFQFFHLLPDFNALENVMIPAMVASGVFQWAVRKRKVRAHARDLLDRLGLSERARHRPSQLSGGERQRVAICRALINGPRVLLLDEPTGNLDSKTGQAILDLVVELNQSEGQTIVMVTHDESACSRAGRVVKIRDGRITR